jgi:hypothetical protein
MIVQPYNLDIGEKSDSINNVIPLTAHSFRPWLNRRAHVGLSLTWPNPGLGFHSSLNSSTVDDELPTGDNVPRCSGTAQPDMLAPRRSESSLWVECDDVCMQQHHPSQILQAITLARQHAVGREQRLALPQSAPSWVHVDACSWCCTRVCGQYQTRGNPAAPQRCEGVQTTCRRIPLAARLLLT